MVGAVRVINGNSSTEPGRGPTWDDLLGICVAGVSSSTQPHFGGTFLSPTQPDAPPATFIEMQPLMSPVARKLKTDSEKAQLFDYWLCGEGYKFFKKRMSELERTKREFCILPDAEFGARLFERSKEGRALIWTPIDKGMILALHSHAPWSENGEVTFLSPENQLKYKFPSRGTLQFERDGTLPGSNLQACPVKITCSVEHFEHLKKALRLWYLVVRYVEHFALESLIISEHRISSKGKSEVIFKIEINTYRKTLRYILPGPDQCRTPQDWGKAFVGLGKTCGLTLEANKEWNDSWLHPFGHPSDDVTWPPAARLLFRTSWREMAETFFSKGGSIEEWNTLEAMVGPDKNPFLKPYAFEGDVNPNYFTLSYVAYDPVAKKYYSGYCTTSYKGIQYFEESPIRGSLDDALEEASKGRKNGKWGHFAGTSSRLLYVVGETKNRVGSLPVQDLLDFFAFLCAEMEPSRRLDIHIEHEGTGLVKLRICNTNFPQSSNQSLNDYFRATAQTLLGSKCLKPWDAWWDSIDRPGAIKRRLRDSAEAQEESEGSEWDEDWNGTTCGRWSFDSARWGVT